MTVLLDLSVELLYIIGETLGTKELKSLSRTSKRCNLVYTPLLNRHALHHQYQVTALYWAAVTGNIALVRLLLNEGTDFCFWWNHLIFPTPISQPQHRSTEDLCQDMLRGGRNNLIQDIQGKCTPLHLATKNGHNTMFKLLLEMGANIMMEVWDSEGLPVLHRAVCESNEFAVRLLLDKGASVNALSRGGMTSLHSAMIIRNEVAVRLLLENGADITLRDDKGKTPLEVGYREHRKKLKLLLLEKCGPDFRTRDGGTALHAVLDLLQIEEELSVAMVEMLLEKGVDVNTQNNIGRTALHQATLRGKLSVLEVLLKSGANPNPQDASGSSPLHHSVYASLRDRLSMTLLEYGADVNIRDANGDTVIDAMFPKNVYSRLPQFLLEAVEPNYRVRGYGRTTLHLAVNGSSVSFVKKLLDGGADIASTDDLGWTPLHVAANCGDGTSGDKEMIELLLERGADWNARNKNGETPIDLTCRCRRKSMLLLEKADVNFRTSSSNMTVLHLAVGEGDLAVMKRILDKGVEINALDSMGRTALHYAAKSAKPETINLLLENGATINVRDNKRQTPIFWALRNGYCKSRGEEIGGEMVERLLDGVDVNEPSTYGVTLFQEAAVKGHKVAMEILRKKGARDTY